MKKSFKVLAIAAIASLTLVACNSNQTTDSVIDSTAVQQIAEPEDVTIDETVLPDSNTVAAEEPVAEQKAAKKATTKTTTKKAEVEVKVSENPEEIQKTTSNVETPEAKKASLKKRR